MERCVGLALAVSQSGSEGVRKGRVGSSFPPSLLPSHGRVRRMCLARVGGGHHVPLPDVLELVFVPSVNPSFQSPFCPQGHYREFCPTSI